LYENGDVDDDSATQALLALDADIDRRRSEFETTRLRPGENSSHKIALLLLCVVGRGVR
jgi:hypothetical protein